MDARKMTDQIENEINNLFLQERYKEADEAVKKIQLSLISMQAVILLKEKRYDEAEDILKNTLDETEFEFDLLYNLAYLYQNTGRYDEAIEKYKEAREYNQNQEINSEIEEIIRMIQKNHTNEPLVSVCIPVYNDEDNIVKAVNSVLKQTYQNFEIIICDNNSEDKTFDLLCSIQDQRIRLIKNEKNIGWMLNSNKVLKLAKGKYVVTLHGDDSYNENYIENVVEIFNANKRIGIIHFIQDNLKKLYFDDVTCLKSEKYYSKIAGLRVIPAPTQTALKKDALLNSNYYEKEYWTAEARLFLNIAKQGFDAYIEGQYLFERYQGSEKDSSQIDKQILRFEHLYHFYEEYKQDKRIKSKDLILLKKSLAESFINLFKNKHLNNEINKAFIKNKELIKNNTELSNLVLDFVFQ